ESGLLPDINSWLEVFTRDYGILQGGGFDVIIGNPPYVEYSKVKKQYAVVEYKTEKCGNLYAMSIERSFDLSKGPVGMIVQLPLVCTDRMKPAQSLFKTQNRKSWFANFDDRPGKLFDDLQHIRATIFLTTEEKDIETTTLYSTKYNRWFTETRSILFEGIVYEDITNICVEGAFPKIADSVGKSVVSKLRNAKKSILTFKTGKYLCHFHNSPQYWIRATDFVPYFWNEQDGEKISTHVKPLHLTTELDASIVAATLNSSLFYWWFVILSNCRDLTLREVRSFPIAVDQMAEVFKQILSELSADLMQDLKRHAQRKETNYKTTGKVVYDEFFPRHSKSIIDEIDRVLAKHYGFTDEELDFIINYDIKYRMGLGN
ncbi:MAG: Eco57I restriction-modification methylase domain-containing protein, partial [Candidatus Poribacteria bacterium]|nr:Eco57I restriction-modification methylase domain-containing protein [Candidatus Poribacteria bacterium]